MESLQKSCRPTAFDAATRASAPRELATNPAPISTQRLSEALDAASSSDVIGIDEGQFFPGSHAVVRALVSCATVPTPTHSAPQMAAAT